MVKRANSEGSIYKDSKRGDWRVFLAVGKDSSYRPIRLSGRAPTQREAIELLKSFREKRDKGAAALHPT